MLWKFLSYFPNVLFSCLQVGAWKDRIIISTGKYGPTPSLLKAFLDSGAKAVISSSIEPPETQSLDPNGTVAGEAVENGKFVIGDDEVEDEEAETDEAETGPPSSVSDWEDSDLDRVGDSFISWKDDDEEELSLFVCHLYDMLFREGTSVDVALQHAQRSHPKLRYSCHLPNTIL